MTGILTKCAICLLAILSGLVSIPAIAAPPEPATQETNKPLEPRALLRGNLSTVRAMAWSSDDKTLASGTNEGTVRLWDITPAGARARSVLPMPKDAGAVITVSFAPDGKSLVTAAAKGGLI